MEDFRNGDYTSSFFQRAWGPNGYYEKFSYGVGLDRVFQVAVEPFCGPEVCALELGPGGGVFTEYIVNRVKHLTALDVIPQPPQFSAFRSFTYLSLPDQCYQCNGVLSESIDFAFSYNVFCHLSNKALAEYCQDVARVVKPGGDFVFMLSDFHKVSKMYFPDEADNFKPGDLLPNGHFYQSIETIPEIARYDQWIWREADLNMIPEHRDRIVHLRRN